VGGGTNIKKQARVLQRKS